ncbi:MAG: DUF4981 domain-containing protein, partial [Hungatella sp.]
YGGDFTDRPTDYNFCGNGIVYADRTVSPKAQEVKFLYQDLVLEPGQDRVLIHNKQLFQTTADYEFHYVVLRDGILIWETCFQAEVAPMMQEIITVKAPVFSEAGEYAYQVSALLKQDTLWAEAGFEVAFGETLIKVSDVITAETPHQAETSSMTVVHGDGNIGISGTGFQVLFSKAAGGIVSLRYHEVEWITTVPMPTYWRATTDNDRGNRFSLTGAMWMGADLFCRYENTEFEMTEEADRVAITYTYELPTTPKTQTVVTYSVTADGCISVKVHYHGQKGLPELPLLGMRLRLPGTDHTYRWYGMGPDENYADRAEGARLGIFNSTPQQNLSHYLVPQECGNRTGTRWLEVRNPEGAGIRFAQESEPFDQCVLPYTAEELESALHREELPIPHYTVVSILGRQRGVGGDDSWGAPVHPKYCICAEEDIEFAFRIEEI